MTISALLLPIMMAEPAHAWRHTKRVFDRDDFPFEWYVSDSYEDSWSDPDTTEIDALMNAWHHWGHDAECADLTDVYMGQREGHNAGYTFDNISTFYFDDPADELGTGVLGAALTLPQMGGEIAFTLSGDTYTYATDSDIIFNDDIVWFSDDQIRAGQCNGGFSLEGVATHEIGHLWGMGHSCEEGEVCNDLDKRLAVMYWSGGPCSVQQSHLHDDDVKGITALYGPYAAFYSDSVRNGGIPLDVCFDLELDASNSDIAIEWNFGDGTISEEPIEFELDENGDYVLNDDGMRVLVPVCHKYETAGQFSVSMKVTGEQAQCGEWNHTQRELAYVTVCEKPRPSEGFDGLFTYEPVEGTIYQMINQVDTSVYGCIDRIRWDVFKDGEDTPIQSVSAWSPKINFPSEGTYRVVLNVGAPGELYSAAQLKIEVESAGGCSSVPASGGIAGLLVGLLGLAYRRRD